jgi:hypothetical protein
VYLTHDECSLTGWRIEQSSCRPIDQDRHLQHHMAKRFHNAFSVVLHHDVSRLDYTQADGRPQIRVFGDKDTRTSQVGFFSLSKCRNASKCDAFRAAPLQLWERFAVTWRAPGRWKRDAFLRFRCTRDAFRGCHLFPSGKSGRNATHSSLHHGVG